VGIGYPGDVIGHVRTEHLHGQLTGTGTHMRHAQAYRTIKLHGIQCLAGMHDTNVTRVSCGCLVRLSVMSHWLTLKVSAFATFDYTGAPRPQLSGLNTTGLQW